MPAPPSTDLAKLFGFMQQETVAIMGSGGKTTLLWYLAQAFRQQKVLVTPTTKLFLPLSTVPMPMMAPVMPMTPMTQISTTAKTAMMTTMTQVFTPPTPSTPSASSACSGCSSPALPYDRFYDSEAFALLSPDLSEQAELSEQPDSPKAPEVPPLTELPPSPGIYLKGITLAGKKANDYSPPLNQPEKPPSKPNNNADDKRGKRREVSDPTLFAHKITPLPQDLLAHQRFLFDKVFMECDGARNLPLKGWSASEPVIPYFTSTVIAVIPLWAIGLRANHETIHRAELFYAMTGCQEGDSLTMEHLARAIAHPEGLLAKAGARRIILFLHCAEKSAPQGSHHLANQLVSLLPQNALEQTSRIVVGSAREGWGKVVWDR